LKYFDARGVAEVSRVMLAIGGAEYSDSRYAIERTADGGFATPEFAADKASGALATNLGRAPLLLVDGQPSPLGQSRAIERYLARECGLMGTTPFEAALIDSVAEHVRDVKDAQGKKGFGMMSRDKSADEKETAKAEWYGADLPDWLQRIEACVAPIESAICGPPDSPTYAAVCIWSLLTDNGAASAEDRALLCRAAEGCTALNAIADAVAGHPRVAAWLEGRPVTMM